MAIDPAFTDPLGGLAPVVGFLPACVEARSMLAAASSVRLTVDGVSTDLHGAHCVMDDGRVLLSVPAVSAAGGTIVGARGRSGATSLDVTEVTSVSTRTRVRARLHLVGTISALDPALLDHCGSDVLMAVLHLPAGELWVLDPQTVTVRGPGATTTVTREDFRSARPDPVCHVAPSHLAQWVPQHMDCLDALVELMGPEATGPSTRLVPVSLCSLGLVMRAESPTGSVDVRLPFDRPASNEAELDDRMSALVRRARAARADAVSRTAA